MILILSEESDHATNDVIDWLLHWKKPFVRINDTDVISIVSMFVNHNGNDIRFSVNDSGTVYSLRQFTSYWYRRGDIRLRPVKTKSDHEIGEKINTYFQNENSRLRAFFLKELDKIPNRIGSIFDLNTNKLSNLVTAAECGLMIPHTHIVTQTPDFDRITKTPHISKAIYNNFDVFKPHYTISSYTTLVESNTQLEEQGLFPSLLQQFIDKQFDIRVVYLRKKIWAAAIFSQNDEQTKTDYRKYNDKKPNRIEAIELPTNLKKNIRGFMQKLNMASGSLDFAVTKDNTYYFLEINPVGQFSSISFACGFNIEKAIAEELAHTTT
jgi:ATP-GRASP peptide maturase of grasp-with-spasm system